MPFLAISGVTVKVAVESVSFSYEDVGGEQERSPSGALEGGPTTVKRQWKMATTVVPASELDAWVGLIEGKGHSWPFDADLYSKRGRGPSSGTAAIVNGTAKWGAGVARLAAGTTVTWATQLGSAWTGLHWRMESGTWKHYVTRSDGARWANGIRVADGLSTGLSVVNGSVVITGSSNLTDYDDVVVRPYAVPDSWPAQLYAQHNAAAWSNLPRVLASGSFYPSTLTVRGKVTDTRAVRYSSAGALTTGYTLDFTLREV